MNLSGPISLGCSPKPSRGLRTREMACKGHASEWKVREVEIAGALWDEGKPQPDHSARALGPQHLEGL